jgi:hypothetical protein
VPWLSQSVAGILATKCGLNARPVHVGFVVDKVAVEPGFLRVLRFSPVSIIVPVLLANSFICQRRFTISVTGSEDINQKQIKDYRNVNITVFFLIT